MKHAWDHLPLFARLLATPSTALLLAGRSAQRPT